MLRPIVWIFLGTALVFAAVHAFAVYTSLYWYHWWFDSVMHVWGGGLVVLGVHALTTFSRVQLRPTFLLSIGTLLFIVIIWELFEWFVGLYDPITHVFDTSKDIVLGLASGLVTQFFLVRFRMKGNE